MRTRAATIGAMAAAASCVSLVAVGQASAATSLIAAYDKYVAGQGFDVGLVDVGTGNAIAVPAGVNTADDEIHPSLTADGRLLVFTRMKVQPLLNGDVIPPSSRTLLMVDRSNGQFRNVMDGENLAGAGATITPGPSGEDQIAFGLRPPFPRGADSQTRIVTGGARGPNNFIQAANRNTGITGTAAGESANSVLDVPEATLLRRSDGRTHVHAQLQFDPSTGRTNDLKLLFEARTTTSAAPTSSLALTARQQPSLRAGDGYAAFSTFTPGAIFSNIETMLFPAQTTPETAPAIINPPHTQTKIQTMPAWSPDGSKLAFVRHPAAGDRDRKLLVYETAPGIQTIMNAAIDLGDPAPTAQLGNFHDLWGGVSLATETRPDAVAVSCSTPVCRNALTGPTGNVQLSPAVVGLKTNVGIVVARVTGTRSLFGRTVPKLRPLGRVPLGLAKPGRNSFRWNGKVGGRKLKRGTYVITFRALTSKGRIRAISKTIRFRVTKSGRITSPKEL
jgi:hypothetical protein